MSAALRPLPSRPNLEFEHKEAKALLRRLRAGDPEAISRARARHSGIDASKVKLADAQLVIAREFGFASWPKLVRYFEETDKQCWHSSLMRPEQYHSMVRAVLVEHRDRRTWTARLIACFVPRFYGMRVEEVFNSTISEDEARLAWARSQGFPSWGVMLEYAAAELHHELATNGEANPRRLAYKAMEAGDLGELKRLVEASSELVRPSDYLESKGGRILASALHCERTKGAEAMRPIIEWLVSLGLDLQLELNIQLCGSLSYKPDDVRWLLDRGADPNWIAPNGFPVLEHALLRYHSGEAIDVLANRTVPRNALWIAAGLGDVDGVRRSLDKNGKPTKLATRLRPPFGITGPFISASSPDPDDEELLMEAFIIALWNGRAPVLEYMVSRGFDLNSLAYGVPPIVPAVGDCNVSVVETLIRCGADLDLKGWRPNQSARELARELFEQTPLDPRRRRIAELCGLDPDRLLAESDARAAR